MKINDNKIFKDICLSIPKIINKDCDVWETNIQTIYDNHMIVEHSQNGIHSTHNKSTGNSFYGITFWLFCSLYILFQMNSTISYLVDIYSEFDRIQTGTFRQLIRLSLVHIWENTVNHTLQFLNVYCKKDQIPSNRNPWNSPVISLLNDSAVQTKLDCLDTTGLYLQVLVQKYGRSKLAVKQNFQNEASIPNG